MSELLLRDRLIPSEHVVSRELCGESVLLDLQSGVYFGLDAVSTRMWTLLSMRAPLAELAAVLAREFDVPPSLIETELLRFASELCARGLCRVASEGEAMETQTTEGDPDSFINPPKPFVAPSLQVYGDISSLTRTVGKTGKLDGGGGVKKATQT